MSHSNRRIFILQAAVTGTAALAALQARAADPALLETDPQAVALGYKPDSAQVDAKKYPKHEATQHCASCQLFAGKATDQQGPCPLFAGKQVAAKGWCSAWVKKA